MSQALQVQFMKAVALHQQGKLAEAKVIYESILKSYPKHADTLHLLGVIEAQLGAFDKAYHLIEQAIKILPTNPNYYFDFGNVQLALRQNESALQSYEQAVILSPEYTDAHFNLAMVQQGLSNLEGALKSLDAVIRLAPNHVDAIFQRAITSYFLGKYSQALSDFSLFLTHRPDHAEAHHQRANTLISLHRINEAIEGYRSAISFNSNHVDAHNNLGCALQEAYCFDQALVYHEAAIRIMPSAVSSYFNAGTALLRLNRYEEAIARFGEALELDPQYDFLFGNCLYLKMKVCDWSNYQSNMQLLLEKVNRGEKAISAFAFLALVDSALLQQKVAKVWISAKHPENNSLGRSPKVNGHRKIRIGYFSADFHNHATAWLMAELFERHDKDRFELFAFSFGRNKQDEMRQRIAVAFDQFFDVRNKSDLEVAQLSRSWGIDIAIDLKGFTEDARTGIFAHRAAPIQVNYLGYPGTMGASYIDYIIADRTLIPEASQRYYSEKVVYLRGSYQVNDCHRKISDRIFTKAEVGLPESGFVFCCFNNNYKITPDVFDSWVRILKAVPSSVLWLFEDNPIAAANLRKEAQQRGLDPNRLVFAKRMALAEHLARHRLADLFLDTLPCNAHTTASDALWVGLPVLTRVGEPLAARVAASLLNAIQLPELITQTEAEYEALAIDLATHPDKLSAIKDKLQQNRLATPLFDTQRYTTNLEAVYSEMYERYRADLPPEHLVTQD